MHEIKHDGFRIITPKNGAQVRPYSRPGNDLTDRFSLIVEAMARLRSRSCTLDGEAVCCDNDGRPSFDRIRYRRHDATVFLYALTVRVSGSVSVTARSLLGCARSLHFVVSSMPGKLQLVNAIPRHRKLVLNRA